PRRGRPDDGHPWRWRYSSSAPSPRSLRRNMHRRHRMLHSERNKSFAARVNIASDVEPSSLLTKTLKGCTQFADTPDQKDLECAAPDAHSILRLLKGSAPVRSIGAQIVGVFQETKHSAVGK